MLVRTRPWCHRQHADSKVGHLVGRALGEDVERRLCSRIACRHRVGRPGDDRGDVDDRPRTPLAHLRQHCLDQVHRPEVKDLEEPSLFLQRRVFDRAPEADARVVDEDVDRTEFGDRPGDGRVVGDIGDYPACDRRVRQQGGVEVERHDLVSPRGQLVHRCTPDPRPGARDQRPRHLPAMPRPRRPRRRPLPRGARRRAPGQGHPRSHSCKCRRCRLRRQRGPVWARRSGRAPVRASR